MFRLLQIFEGRELLTGFSFGYTFNGSFCCALCILDAVLFGFLARIHKLCGYLVSVESSIGGNQRELPIGAADVLSFASVSLWRVV